MNGQEKILLSHQLLLLITVWAVGTLVLGLMLDLLSIKSSRHRVPGKLSSTGLPLIPWLLYFTSAFFLFLRGNPAMATIELLILTIWHIGVRRIVRN